jgi:predicted porin
MGRNPGATSDVLENGSTAQNKSLIGASYFGHFFDKAFGIIGSIHSEAIQPDVNYNFYALGLSYKLYDWTLQADYLMNTFQSVVGTFKPKDIMTSVVLNLAYQFNPNWILQSKVASSQEKFDATSVESATNGYTDYGLTIEWKPKADGLFRYHAAYISRNESPAAGSQRQLNEAILGMRIYADFLK